MLKQYKAFKHRLNANKDGKALAGNFGYLMIMQIAGYVFPLLTLPYLARVIGVEGFGKIAFAAAIIVWFQTITDWGFSYTATRDVARNRDNVDKVSEIFSNVFWAKSLLAVLSFILLFVLTEFIPYLKENQLLLFLTFMLVPTKIIFADWFFQAIEKMKFITIFDLVTKISFTLCVFIFINDKEDFILQPIFLALGSFLVGLVSFYLIIFKWKYKILTPKYHDIYLTLKNSKDIFINNIVNNLYNSFSVVLVGIYGGIKSNGILDAGTRFINISYQFMNIISKVFFPFLSRKIDSHSLFLKLNLTISLILSVSLFIFSPLIIKFFFPPDFYDSINVLRVMSISIIFLALNNIYGINYMVLKGYDRDLRNITLTIAILGFIFSFPLIYYFDFMGAALNITLVRISLGLTVMFKAKSLQRRFG